MDLQVVHSTCGEPAFEQAVLRPLQFSDFDGWGESGETEVLFTIAFG